MRNLRETQQLTTAKDNSSNGRQTKTIVKTPSKREFFRFEDGRVIEYDLTFYNSRPVALTDEEKQVANSFSTL